MSISEQFHTYPSPNLTLTLTCYQLTVVVLGEDADTDPNCNENNFSDLSNGPVSHIP